MRKETAGGGATVSVSLTRNSVKKKLGKIGFIEARGLKEAFLELIGVSAFSRKNFREMDRRHCGHRFLSALRKRGTVETLEVKPS